MTHQPIKNLEKMAAKDAHDWARAEMFFGEGAGVRRRHLEAQIWEKMNQIPGYEALYQKHYAAQNMIEHAEKALAERKKIDRAAKAGKNLRALKNGNFRGLSTGLFYVGVGYVFFYQTETGTAIRKQAEVEGKKAYAKVRTELRYRKARMQGKNVTKIVG